MPSYAREVVAEVLAANDIVDIIGESVELKPAGSARFKGLCPFHTEKTPSFHVSRDRQAYYCFGCEKGGDAIAFIRDYEGLTFLESIKRLADRAGVALPAMSESDNKRDFLRTRLLELGKFAGRFFLSALEDPLKGNKARAYLKTRELKPETVERFGIGFAPDSYTALLDAATESGFPIELQLSSGLAKKGERGSEYAFFRNRLMVPIRDVSGNVVAFGGRDLGGESPAKYINSPENEAYKKSRVLYGLHEARDAMRRRRQAILVEGYFDLLRCFDVGIECVVATCGTALTPEQAALIHRYVPEVIVVFDGDAAGVRAALRSIAILTGAGLTVRALVLPDNMDPDDFIRDKGVDAFEALIESSLDFVTFYTQMNESRTRTIEGRTDLAKEIFTILLDVKEELRRTEYLKRTANQLGLDPFLLRSEFSRFLAERSRSETRKEASEGPVRATFRPMPVSQDDCDFVGSLIHSEPLLEKARAALEEIALPEGPVVEVLRALFEGSGTDAYQQLKSAGAQQLYAASANTEKQNAEHAAAVVNKRILRLKREALMLEKGQIQEQMREAERSEDSEKLMELFMRKAVLDKELEAVGAT